MMNESSISIFKGRIGLHEILAVVLSVMRKTSVFHYLVNFCLDFFDLAATLGFTEHSNFGVLPCHYLWATCYLSGLNMSFSYCPAQATSEAFYLSNITTVKSNSFLVPISSLWQ